MYIHSTHGILLKDIVLIDPYMGNENSIRVRYSIALHAGTTLLSIIDHLKADVKYEMLQR